MSSINDVGISPVLLQAISQSLTSTSPSRNSSTAHSNTDTMEDSNGSASAEREMVSRLIQQSQSASMGSPVTASDTIKTMLKIKMAANAFTKSITNEDGIISSSSINHSFIKNDPTTDLTSSASDLAMANVLTALASQGSKNQQLETSATSDPGIRALMIGGQRVLIRTKPGNETGHVLVTGAGVCRENTEESDDESLYTMIKTEPGSSGVVTMPVKVPKSQHRGNVSKFETVPYTATSQIAGSNINMLTLQSSPVEATHYKSGSPVRIVTENPTVCLSSPVSTSTATNPMMICYDPETGAPGLQSIIVPQNSGQQIIEHEGKRYIIHTTNIPSSLETASATKYIAVQSSSGGHCEDNETYTGVEEHEVVSDGVSCQTTIAVPVYTDPGAAGATGTPCPICSDNVSGFHYGIFTCESCKGFFKRTVQNKKTFLCHRQGECEITLENRKKCPACRFAKCLVMGMKLEAIRQDRTRGGRSSYTGLSPLDEAKRKRPIKIVQRRPSLNSPQPSDSRLVTVLNYGDQSACKPFVPQILTDIMNLESLLCDDDIPANISGEEFSISDPNVFLTLLQLCELKLYKIVRWARNLPYFANISTDDQILLLQNCWCELLALTMCWKSIHLTSEIVFFHGQTIDLDKANTLEVGEMFTMLLSVVEQFKRLKLDNYECVALKVIILICPDIKGLNDADKLGEQQAKVSGALEAYTSSHYHQSPNKFGEVILRLGELSRISGLLKEHLVSWMPPNTTSCGLLYELLKGENMKDLV